MNDGAMCTVQNGSRSNVHDVPPTARSVHEVCSRLHWIAASRRPAELPAWLVVFAARLASRIGVQALPHSTPREEEAAETEQRKKSDD